MNSTISNRSKYVNCCFLKLTIDHIGSVMRAETHVPNSRPKDHMLANGNAWMVVKSLYRCDANSNNQCGGDD